MSARQAQLTQLFCQECLQRMQHAEMVWRTLAITKQPSVCLEQLQQEFDSLYGAARAINDLLLEDFFDVMRRYVRYLARQMSESVISKQELTIIHHAITLLRQCNDCQAADWLRFHPAILACTNQINKLQFEK